MAQMARKIAQFLLIPEAALIKHPCMLEVRFARDSIGALILELLGYLPRKKHVPQQQSLKVLDFY